MLIWTRWGIAIPFLGYLGAIVGNYSALAAGRQLHTDAPWLMATGWVVGAMAASLFIQMFREWRATRGGEPQKRVIVDEQTSERFEIPVPGDTFFWLHTHVWIWVALVVGAVAAAVTIYQQTPLREM